MIGKVALMLALIAAGMVLFLLEIVTPTFGLLAAIGLAALGAAVWAAFTISSLFGLIMAVVLILTIPAYIVFLVRLLPKTPLGRRLFLKSSPDATGDAAPQSQTHEALVGREGVAESLLRPSGAIRVEGRRIIAVAESGTIEKGAKVLVIRASGSNVTVREITEQQ